MDVISLTVDSKKRISLTKLLPPGNIRSVRAYTEGHRIVLEPMMEVPVGEAWLFENRDSLKKVLTGRPLNNWYFRTNTLRNQLYLLHANFKKVRNSKVSPGFLRRDPSSADLLRSTLNSDRCTN